MMPDPSPSTLTV